MNLPVFCLRKHAMPRFIRTVTILALVTAAIAFPVAPFCCAEEPSPPDWENPHVVGRNKEPGHATLMPYADKVQAGAFDRER